MGSYSDALNEELKSTTLKKSFVRADEQAPKKDEVFFSSFANGNRKLCFMIFIFGYAIIIPFKLHARLCNRQVRQR